MSLQIKTLTKSGDLKNYHGLRSIKFKKNGEVNDVIVKDKGLMAIKQKKQKKQKTYNLTSLFDEKPKKKEKRKILIKEEKILIDPFELEKKELENKLKEEIKQLKKPSIDFNNWTQKMSEDKDKYFNQKKQIEDKYKRLFIKLENKKSPIYFN